MRYLPIHFHGSISLQEIEQALHRLGMHLRDDGRGRILVDRVPRFVTRTAEAVAPAHPPMRIMRRAA